MQIKSKKVMSRKKALGWSLLLSTIVGGLGTLFAYAPDFHNTPILGLTTVWTFTLAIGIASYRNALQNNWVTTFIITFSLSTLFLASAIHALAPYFSGRLWIVILSGVYILAWALPLLKPRIALIISNEQLMPRTWLGRYSLFIIGVTVAFIIGLFNISHKNPIHPGMLFIGTMAVIAALSSGQSFAVQVFQQREVEIRDQEVI
jgi:hypothetical protein